MRSMELILEKYKFLGLFVILGIVAHIASGKSRWQYYPIYFVGLVYLVMILLNYFNILNLNPPVSKWMMGIGLLLIIISIILIIILPMEKLPKPSGNYKIGTVTYDLQDKTREEKYTADKNDKRKIKYQVWYPAEKTKGHKRAKWIYDGKYLTRQLASSMYMPSFMLDHTSKINSNSYLKAPVDTSLDRYPIVIISHGWSGFRELHTDYAEELASNGFIAASIDHSYGSQGVKFEDGTTIDIKKDAIKNSNLLVKTYGEDVVSVLDDIEKLNKDDEIFKGKLDLDSIGALAHSTGGGGIVHASLKDPRIKTLLGLDAWVEPIQNEIRDEKLAIPALFLRSEQWSKGPNNKPLINLVKNSDRASLIQMNDTNHVDFSMSYMYSPITKYIGFTGKLGGRVSSKVQREFILNFFEDNLRAGEGEEEEKDLKEIADKYDFVEIIELK
nr:hypothetical protein [Tissierella sp.]